MAYARMVEGSDVYLWPGPKGIHCTCCRLTEKEAYTIEPDESEYIDEKIESEWYTDVIVETAEEALEHLKEHEEAGHNVPQNAINRLKDEINR